MRPGRRSGTTRGNRRRSGGGAREAAGETDGPAGFAAFSSIASSDAEQSDDSHDDNPDHFIGEPSLDLEALRGRETPGVSLRVRALNTDVVFSRLLRPFEGYRRVFR